MLVKGINNSWLIIKRGGRDENEEESDAQMMELLIAWEREMMKKKDGGKELRGKINDDCISCVSCVFAAVGFREGGRNTQGCSRMDNCSTSSACSHHSRREDCLSRKNNCAHTQRLLHASTRPCEIYNM